MLFQGSLSELQLFQKKGSRLLIKTADNDIACKLLQDHQPNIVGECISVAFDDLRHVAQINRTLTKHDVDVYLLQPQENDLEQLFIELTSAQS